MVKRIKRPEQIRGDGLSPRDRSVLTPAQVVAALRRSGSTDVLWSAGHPTKNGARVKASNAARGRHSSWRGLDVSGLVFYHVPRDDAGAPVWDIYVGRRDVERVQRGVGREKAS